MAAGLGIICAILVSVVIALSIQCKPPSIYLPVLKDCQGSLTVYNTVMLSCLTAVKTVTSEWERQNTGLTAQNLQLQKERTDLEKQTEELTRERDRLNWTITAILGYDNFPVNTHCPKKGEEKNGIIYEKICQLVFLCRFLNCKCSHFMSWLISHGFDCIKNIFNLSWNGKTDYYLFLKRYTENIYSGASLWLWFCYIIFVSQYVNLVWTTGYFFNQTVTCLWMISTIGRHGRKVVRSADNRIQIWWWSKARRNRQDWFYNSIYIFMQKQTRKHSSSLLIDQW